MPLGSVKVSVAGSLNGLGSPTGGSAREILRGAGATAASASSVASERRAASLALPRRWRRLAAPGSIT